MLVAEEAVEIRVLSRQGKKSIREIARMLNVSRNTVRRYLRSEGLPRYKCGARPGKLDAYAIPSGRALDAVCGIGRHTEYLCVRGFETTGVDVTPEMLALAREKVSFRAFRGGRSHFPRFS